MVSILTLVSCYQIPFIRHLRAISKATFITGITVTFMFRSFFGSLSRSTYLSLFSHFFHFHYVLPKEYDPLDVVLFLFFFFSFFLFIFWLLRTSWMIRFYLKFPKYFTCLLFWDRFWFVNILFVSMVNFRYNYSYFYLTL